MTTNWLDSLIKDPKGLHYFTRKSREQRYVQPEHRLQRTTQFLNFLGNPQDTYRAVHVTGTSGKGSVATMTATLLQQTIQPRGLYVGLHVSPYIQVPREKLIIDGYMVSDSEYRAAVADIKKQYEQYCRHIQPSDMPNYGEVWIALTHRLFSRHAVRWGVIEVGMGGRFDPTNILNTRVAVITNVDYDHVDVLGPKLEDIAWNKAGIIKRGIPTVTGVTQPELLRVIREEARKQHSELWVIGTQFSVRNVRLRDNGVVADILTPRRRYTNLFISMCGAFQATNAAMAICAAQLALQEEGIDLSEEQVRAALGNVSMVGRFEIMQQDPLVVLDSAHNPAKMKALSELLRAQYHNKKITLIIGMLKTKDVLASIRPIIPLAHRIIASESVVLGKPSLPAAEMKAIINAHFPHQKVDIEPDVQKATHLAIQKLQGKSGAMIVITGSMYMLGKARELFVLE